MKISIITVVYNNEKTILDSINSVRNQTYKNIEHIFIDGGSLDNTLKIINENISCNSIIISEKDDGLYHAMNKGIKVATGDIIGILNSDDVYDNFNVIEHIANHFISDSKLKILYGDLVYVKADDIDIQIRYWESKNITANYFENGYVPPHPTLFITKDVYNSVGLFDLNFKLAADYEFILRLFKKHSFKSLYLPLLIVRMRLGGVTNKKYFNIYKQNIEILNSWKVNKLEIPAFFIFKRFFIKIKQYF
jgi:glycosyltransferase involved in cell wall biosynthesis